MILLIYIKSLQLLFWLLFLFKNIKLVLQFFLVLIWFQFFEKNDFLFVKFLESDQDFFIKIEVVNKDGFLCWCN